MYFFKNTKVIKEKSKSLSSAIKRLNNFFSQFKEPKTDKDKKKTQTVIMKIISDAHDDGMALGIRICTEQLLVLNKQNKKGK